MDNSTTFQGDGEVVYIPVVVNGKQARQTNGDNFRAMSDEELAMKLSEIEYSAVMSDKAWHPAKWLEWLRQTVEEGE